MLSQQERTEEHLNFTGAIAIVVLTLMLAIVASWLAARFINLETRRRYHEVGMPMFAQLGLLLSVLIAFIFSGVWADYKTADDAMSMERSELHGAAMLASTLHGGGGKPIERAIQTYANAGYLIRRRPIPDHAFLSSRFQHQ